VPSTLPAEDGWESYVDAPVLDPASTAGVLPGQDSAEAALMHFYASWLRGDDEHLAAVPPEGERHPDYGAVLEGMALKSFRSFRLVARKRLGEEAYLVRFQLEALSDGQFEAGEQEAVVQRLGGAWYVTQPPA
jgi:hypothetical protein